MGHSISEVAGLSEEALRDLVGAVSTDDLQPNSRRLVAQIIDDLQKMDVQRCDATLSAAFVNLDPWHMVEDVITPLLHEVGELWQRGDIAIGQEHVISTLVRMRLYASLQSIPPALDRPLVLFTTLGGERHELGAIAACYLARASGLRGAFVGADMPADDVINMATGLKAAVLGISITNPTDNNNALRKLHEINRDLPDTIKIWLGGAYARDVGAALDDDRIMVIDSQARFRRALMNP